MLGEMRSIRPIDGSARRPSISKAGVALAVLALSIPSASTALAAAPGEIPKPPGANPDDRASDRR